MGILSLSISAGLSSIAGLLFVNLYFYIFNQQRFRAGRAINSSPAATPVRWQQPYRNLSTLNGVMKNIFYRLKSVFFKEVPIQKDKKKELSQEEKEKSLYGLIHNPPQSVENLFDLLVPKELNEKKVLLIEMNKYYYQNRNSITKETADKIASFQNEVLVEYCWDINPTLKNPYDYGDRAIVKSQLHDPLGAIDDFTKAIKLKPDYENAYIWRGEEKYKISDYEGAISDYQFALELNQENSEVFLNLGKAKFKLGKLDEALSDLKMATALGNKKSQQLIKELIDK